jgi:hypothetical protein
VLLVDPDVVDNQPFSARSQPASLILTAQTEDPEKAAEALSELLSMTATERRPHR